MKRKYMPDLKKENQPDMEKRDVEHPDEAEIRRRREIVDTWMSGVKLPDNTDIETFHDQLESRAVLHDRLCILAVRAPLDEGHPISIWEAFTRCVPEKEYTNVSPDVQKVLQLPLKGDPGTVLLQTRLAVHKSIMETTMNDLVITQFSPHEVTIFSRLHGSPSGVGI